MSDNVHSGHRKRVRQEFLEHGFNEKTPPHKILEMLLFYSIPRRDTNVIAHNLLNKFGSINGVLDAPSDELMKIDGVTENTVALFKLILPVSSAYFSDKVAKNNKFTSSDSMGEFIKAKYIGFTKEVLAITSLNANGGFLGFDIVSEGDSTAVELSFRKVIETVMKRNASYVVISHNHPKANALPSQSDVELTKRIASLLSSINVQLIDHIVIGFDDYVSMAQSREYVDIFKS